MIVVINKVENKEAKMKFSWITNIQKALMKTITPSIVVAITLIATNPQIVGTLLGKWKDITVLEIVLMIVNMILNWWKNKDIK